MLKRVLTSAACLVLILVLSSCSLTGMDSRGLMAPPKANADQHEINTLMQETNTKLAYPKNGEYRSAVIMEDFTGDGEKDAIGFLQLENGMTRAQFMTKQNGQWTTLKKFANTAALVDRVLFGDLNGDGVQDVVIGWGNSQTRRSATVCAYLYDPSGLIEEIPLAVVPSETSATIPYDDILMTDFDSDGITELFVIQSFIAAADDTAEDIPAKAEVFALQDKAFVSLYATAADNNINKYSALSFGSLGNGHFGVIVDGSTSNGILSTQIFFLDGDAQSLIAYPSRAADDLGAADPFSRPTTLSLLSRDINGDRILDIPQVSLLPAISADNSDSTSYLVNWTNFTKDADGQVILKNVLYSLINREENYYFRIPAAFKDKITALNNTRLRSVTYYAVESNGKEGEDASLLMGSRIFSIRVFDSAAWEEIRLMREYEMLAVQGDLIYAMTLFDKETASSYLIETVRESFSMME